MTTQPPVTVRMFAQRLSPTPLGARLALHQLHAWGIPHGSTASDTAGAIVAELAANAVPHGRVPGRDFELRLSLVTGSVRIEVTGTRTGPRPPAPGAVEQPDPLDETGRGLVLVEALADRWEVVERVPPPGKTVRVEIDVPRWLALVRRLDGASGSAQVGAGGWPVCADAAPAPPKPPLVHEQGAARRRSRRHGDHDRLLVGRLRHGHRVLVLRRPNGTPSRGPGGGMPTRAMPSGGPGGGGNGMGPGRSEVKYADFKGLTTDGRITDGLTAKERKSRTFDVDDNEWPGWSNADGYQRKGVRMGDITRQEAQPRLHAARCRPLRIHPHPTRADGRAVGNSPKGAGL